MAAVTLAVDIGGSAIKCGLLDAHGAVMVEAVAETPRPATPATVLGCIETIADTLGVFDRCGVGFPGVVQDGWTVTAPNLDGAWADGRFNLAGELGVLLGAPVRCGNDADVALLGVARTMPDSQRGTVLMVTLGTGCGTALMVDGRLIPNLEMGQHTCRDSASYDEYIGDAALRQVGVQCWKQRVLVAVSALTSALSATQTIIGGGNARHFTQVVLGPQVSVVGNVAGLLGCIALFEVGASIQP